MINGVCILGHLHHKNKIGIELMCKECSIPIEFVSTKEAALRSPYNFIISTDRYDISSLTINNKKILYGPHIGMGDYNRMPYDITFNALTSWVCDLLSHYGMKSQRTKLPFAVDVNRFCPNPNISRTKTMLYFKHREPSFFEELKQKYTWDYIFQYGSYTDEQFKNALLECKWVCWYGSHESQGFALEETLSSNIPVLILDVGTVYDEVNSRHPRISDHLAVATTAEYFDETCGIKCKKPYTTINECIQKMNTDWNQFNPREYIVKHLSPLVCMERMIKWYESYYKNVFCITSVIHTSTNPLSYTNTRSIYTPSQRLSQTLETISSIRNNIPGAYILVIEGNKHITY